VGEAAPYREASPTLKTGSTGPAVAWLQLMMQGAAVTISFPACAGPVKGIFGPLTESALKGLQSWGGAPATGIADDATWFVWLTPGSAQQFTVEGARGLTANLV
jgi:peptidoglycan hydrolase-like protein with peptidoglycan-binding domain